MSDITLELAAEMQRPALNKYEMLQSESKEVKDFYHEIFNKVLGSYTTVSDNDLEEKFKIALACLDPTEEQAGYLRCLNASVQEVESLLDPVKLQFEIRKAMDDEIVLFRKSENGVSNIIINEDGSLAYSFIGYKDSVKKDGYCFYNSDEYADCESILLNFFSK